MLVCTVESYFRAFGAGVATTAALVAAAYLLTAYRRWRGPK